MGATGTSCSKAVPPWDKAGPNTTTMRMNIRTTPATTIIIRMYILIGLARITIIPTDEAED